MGKEFEWLTEDRALDRPSLSPVAENKEAVCSFRPVWQFNLLQIASLLVTWLQPVEENQE